MELKGKVAIVTGASRGMGRCISKVLAAEGVRVALVARGRDGLQAVADEIAANGGEAIILPTDIRSAEQTEAMAQATLAHFGAIHILVNDAFWGPPASLEDTTEEFWDRTLDTTLKGAFLCTRAVVPIMKKQEGGRIVNIGSLAGKVGEDNRTAYCAAKWGLEGLSAALSVELLKYNIHVHLISPAATNTPWWREVAGELPVQTLERMIPPEVIAKTVRWVLSQPDQVHIPDVPVYNFRNPFEGKGSPFEG
jgi:NAD(P)-dependent dehydrogenase (short-subunit alcohol dehydrogenase family)